MSRRSRYGPIVVCSYEGGAALRGAGAKGGSLRSRGAKGETNAGVLAFVLLVPPQAACGRPLSEAPPLHRYAVYDISLTSMKASRRGFQFRSAATP